MKYENSINNIREIDYIHEALKSSDGLTKELMERQLQIYESGESVLIPTPDMIKYLKDWAESASASDVLMQKEILNRVKG